jgi:type VI secretion system protein ImpA
MIEIEQLLQPVSADSPCGDDISYDSKFLELEALITGKQETQFSTAEEPDWKAIRDACVALLGRSKNLRVAVMLCLSLVKLEGVAGLHAGLTLLKELLTRYWPDLYPKLDPEENNDPLERVNILSSLANPLGTFGDPMRFVQKVRQMPLAKSARMGTFSLADSAGEKRRSPTGEEQPPVSTGEIAAAFRDTPSGNLAATAEAISASIALTGELDAFLMETVGSNRAPDMSALSNVLAEIKKCLSPYLPKTVDSSESEEQVETVTNAAPGGNAGDGLIRSRQDVVRALERICDYYSRVEPSSPLPFLLNRAKRLVSMDFLQIINELTPEAKAHLETIVGVKPDSSGAEGSPI